MDSPDERLLADTVRVQEARRVVVATAVLLAMRDAYGQDNVSFFEDDPFSLGVCFEDGDFVTIQVSPPHIDGAIGADPLAGASE